VDKLVIFIWKSLLLAISLKPFKVWIFNKSKMNKKKKKKKKKKINNKKKKKN